MRTWKKLAKREQQSSPSLRTLATTATVALADLGFNSRHRQADVRDPLVDDLWTGWTVGNW
jgi:hypothetical protein